VSKSRATGSFYTTNMRKVTLQKFIDQFNGKTVEFTNFEIEYRDRMLKVMELIISDITLTDKQIYDKIRQTYKCTYPVVLQDIMVAQRLIANQINPKGDPHKIWIRYLVEQGAKRAIQMAEEKGDSKAYAYAIGMIGKYHMADKEDVVTPDYSEITPFMPVITSDPKVLGIELPPDFEKKRADMKKKFEGDYQNFMRKMTIPDAEIIKEEDED